MSEHKTGRSNWTEEQKQLYLERRQKNVPGQTGYANMSLVIKDEEDNEQRIPTSGTISGGRESRRTLRRNNWKAKRREVRQKQRQQARSNGRGQ